MPNDRHKAAPNVLALLTKIRAKKDAKEKGNPPRSKSAGDKAPRVSDAAMNSVLQANAAVCAAAIRKAKAAASDDLDLDLQ